jgi:hypothetical protein
MSHCNKCECDSCTREREIQRLARILNSWPAGGMVQRRHHHAVRITFNSSSFLPLNLRFA